MTWNHDSIRHSLAARGIKLKRKPWNSMYDVRGLGELVNAYVTELGVPKDASSVIDYQVTFSDSLGWEIVVDASGLLNLDDSTSGLRKRRNTLKRMRDAILSAPAFVLSYDKSEIDSAYVIVGKGGTFVHPPLIPEGRSYKDNEYFQPIAYSGPAIHFPNPVTLYAKTREPDTNEEVEIPFQIAGLVGLEVRVKSEAVSKKRNLEQQVAVLV